MITKAELKKVLEQIKADPENFKMGTWHQHASCGTASCIGGWLERLYPEKYKINPNSMFSKRELLSRGNLPCVGKYFDYRSKLFNVNDWEDFMNAEDLNELREIAGHHITLEISNFNFDGLNNKTKIKFTIKAINSYIEKYNLN